MTRPLDNSIRDSLREAKPSLPDPLIYTVKQAAALVGISPDSYYRSLKEGTVPGLKLRGRWVIPREQLHHFIETGEIRRARTGAAS